MKKASLLLAVIAVILCGTASCKTDDQPSSGDLSSFYKVVEIRKPDKTLASIGLDSENYPVLDGATSTQPIRSLIACKAFGGEYHWMETLDREMWLAPDFSKTNMSNEVIERLYEKIFINSKTHDAYLKLIRGEVDLVLVSTLPSDDELKEAQSLGVKLELCPIGMDGFVFLVNQSNPLTNLKTADIVNIYSGKVDNWQQFTGLDSPITAFTRPPNSGSQELMEKLVMKGVAISPTLKSEDSVIFSMAPLIDGVEYNENAIGYSLYYYKNTMIDKRDDRPNVKLISIDGIEPDPANIASRKYPHVFNIYAVTRQGEPKDSIPYQIKEWLTSTEGQEIITEAGYISLDQ